MPQSSLSTWLQKPKEILQPVAPSTPNLAPTEPSSATQISPSTPLPAASMNTTLRAPTTTLTTSNTPVLTSTSHTRTDHERIADTIPTEPLPPPAQSPLPTSSPSLPTLPSPISFSPLTPSTLDPFRRLNALLLPIPYPSSFYSEIFTDPISSHITLLAHWDPSLPATSSTTAALSPLPASPARIAPNPPTGSTLVAGFRGRIHPHPISSTAPNPLYPAPTPSPSITTSATKEQDPNLPTLYISTLVVHPSYRSYGLATHLFQLILARSVEAYGVKSVTAHVWEANDEGREWYRKRGFEEVGKVEGYYRRLKPQGAVLVRRGVGG